MIKRMYDWVLHWAETPYGTWALFFLAFAESSFFPVPPDVLLITLAISIPAKSFRYALVCSAGSIAGGALGYLIGLQLMEVAGFRIIDFYGLSEEYTSIGDLYNRYNAWAVMIAGFTPIPYKIFTIAGGAFQIDFSVFMAASAISRTARFFLVAWFIYLFGAGIRLFIDKYFNLLTVLFTVLLAGGFILIKYIV